MAKAEDYKVPADPNTMTAEELADNPQFSSVGQIYFDVVPGGISADVLSKVPGFKPAPQKLSSSRDLASSRSKNKKSNRSSKQKKQKSLSQKKYEDSN